MVSSSLASLDHRMRRAGVAAGSHCRHVGGFQKEKSCRSGPASGGRDIDDDRDRRGEDPAHHLAHGIEQAAGRIDLDQHGVGMLGRGRVQPARHVVRADGLNGVVEVDDHHFRVLWACCAWQASVPQQAQNERNTPAGGGSWNRLPLALDLLLQRTRGRILRLQLERAAHVRRRRRLLVGLQVEPGQHQVGGHVRLAF